MNDIEQSYYRVMDLLRRARMEHGLCQPRSRRACSHCNAVDDIKVLVDEYKGAPIRIASFDAPKDEMGWLVEDGNLNKTMYRCMDETGIHWTDDPNKAIRFARREDAEMFAAGDEDAWRIVEHMWCAPIKPAGSDKP